jgi:hypothetical protein
LRLKFFSQSRLMLRGVRRPVFDGSIATIARESSGPMLTWIGQSVTAVKVEPIEPQRFGANISVPTVKRMEASEGPAAGMANNVAAIRAALEASGVEFIPENGSGAGVRLKKGIVQ